MGARQTAAAEAPGTQVTTTGLSSSAKRALIRELAAGDKRRSQLAREYGITTGGITQFAQRNQAAIDEARDRLEDAYAHLWIADKGQRVEAYQRDFEMSLDSPKAGYFEQIRVRTQIQQAVAEELGQLPPRAQVTVMPVVHVVMGVDLDALK